MTDQPAPAPVEPTPAKKPRRTGCLVALAALVVLLAGFWILARPGVFTVQPIGALPDGVTIIYHSRGPQMPFYASPDGLCLEIQGSVSLFCRLGALSAIEPLLDRVIIKLPYSHWAYLQSTGGMEFGE